VIETFAIALVLTVGLIRALMPMAVHLGLVDEPCVRKRHHGEVPLIGGLAIYAALIPLCLTLSAWQANRGTWLMALGFPLLMVGLADDRWEVSARKRFLLEIGCALVAAVYCDVRLYDIGRLIPSFGGTLLVGGTLVWLSIPLTVVGMVGVINAINMTDGVDGLAGGLATLTFAGLAFLSYPTNPAVALQLLTFVAALIGFLYFNSRFFGRKRAAIFMGDGGSIFIGFALAWYLIMLSQGSNAVIRPVDALWLIAVPLLDTGTIMLRRMRQGRSPFAPDREHFHHILLLSGFGASQTVLIMLTAQLCCVLIAVASARAGVPEWFVFGLFIALATFYFTIMNFAWKVMKRIKHFREWAGFEDRRSELRQGIGRASGVERRKAHMQDRGESTPIEETSIGH
jgi:UDP-GlcNAc:undecaprenyl-phosphate GlcNAc-1-phosphate transferase